MGELTLIRDRDGSMVYAPDPDAPAPHAIGCDGEGFTADGRAILCRRCRPETVARVERLRARSGRW